MPRAQELFNKWMKGEWMKGEKYGYLTDDEVNELSILLAQAKDLSIAFKAGDACENYFIQLWYNIEQVRHVRRLP